LQLCLRQFRSQFRGGQLLRLRGMVPDSVSDEVRSNFLDPDLMLPPLIWLISRDADEVTGKRFVATKWRSDLRGREAPEAAAEIAGWWRNLRSTEFGVGYAGL